MNRDGEEDDAAAAFAAFVRAARDEARDAARGNGGLTGEQERALEGLALRRESLAMSEAQPEHRLSGGDYFRRLVSPARIERGREMLGRHAVELGRIEAAFGVPGAVLVAISGIESNFGAAMGDHLVIESLANLAYGDRRRGAFFRREMLAAVAIIGRGDVRACDLVGSWAGAMGHMQFMPSTYLAHGVDFDGDGVADIWRSATDGFASAAHYLRNSGWQAGSRWGYEVALSAEFDFGCVDLLDGRDWNAWQAAVRMPAPIACDAGIALRLVVPAGWRGPSFLVTANFEALLAYNRSEIYALAVGCLADAIAGRAGLSGMWPDEAPLDYDEACDMQRHLMAAGFDTNGVDGILGRASRRAARAYQLRHGLSADGFAGRELLDFMRARAG